MVKQKGKFSSDILSEQIVFSCDIIVGKAVSTHELMLTTISDVVKQLIEAYEQGKDIDLNK